MKNQPFWAFAFMARYSLVMATLAFAFLLASWPASWILPVGDDFPNCVAACWDDEFFAAGCVSIRKTCSIFLTNQDYCFQDRNYTGWYELRDGHFCGFPIPPISRDPSGPNPHGLTFHVSLETLAWSVPYWLLVVVWLLVFGKTATSTRFNLRDLLGAMALVALLMTMFRLRIAFLGILLLNFSTLLLLIHFVTSAIRSFLQTDNILWPVLFQERLEEPPRASP